MKRMILIALAATTLANAGIVKVLTYPVRHPVKVMLKTVHVTKAILW